MDKENRNQNDSQSGDSKRSPRSRRRRRPSGSEQSQQQSSRDTQSRQKGESRSDSRSSDRSRGTAQRDDHGKRETSTRTSARQQKEERSATGSETRARRRTVLRRRRIGRIATFGLLAALLAAVLWKTMDNRQRIEVPYSAFTTEYVEKGRVESVTIGSDRLDAVTTDTTGVQARVRVYLGRLELTPEVTDRLVERGIAVEFRPTSNALNTLLGALPYLAIIAVIILLFRQLQSGSRQGPFGFGKSPAREVAEDVPSVTFEHVAGADEAKQELSEIVEFLKEPEKFQKLGGRIPRGVLMVGPPGTGKTYLARAVAGEARVPFYNISGSDFVEMFVGVGASRVRDLFERAGAKAPCIVFIDELDAVGRHRGAGLGGGHDEREQTLNQLLVEMDGFASSSSTVIIVAATNRPDVLDPALLRPGRFDRQVVISLPDVRGREGILRIHANKLPLAKNVDFEAIARGTPGVSGAELKNMVNEAALLAARNDRREVGAAEFEIAKEKVMWGIERRSLVMSDEERRVTAVHEAGHALVSIYTDDADPVHKCSIIPRGRALGLTWFLPHEERHTVSRSWCMAKLVGLLGGRAAEELVLNEITNGGANDIETATSLARRMVCEWGMSSRIGAVMMGRKEAEVFIGKELMRADNLSEESLRTVDEEIRRVVDEALDQARKILRKHRDALDALTGALLEREVLDRDAIDDIVQARTGAPKKTGEGPVIVERPAAGSRTESRGRRPQQKESGKRERDAGPEEESEADSKRSRHRRRRKKKPQDEAPQETKAREREPRVDGSDGRRDKQRDGDYESRESPRERRHSAEPAPEKPEKVEKPKQEAREKPAGPTEGTDQQPRFLGADDDRGAAVETVEREVSYGRKPAFSRKHALPSSSAPTSGVPVKEVVHGAVTYGRSLRPAEDTREQKLMKRALEKDGAGDSSSDTSKPKDTASPPQEGAPTDGETPELPAVDLLEDGVDPIRVENLKNGIRVIRRNRGKKSVWRQRFARRNAVARRKRVGTLRLGRKRK